MSIAQRKELGALEAHRNVGNITGMTDSSNQGQNLSHMIGASGIIPTQRCERFIHQPLTSHIHFQPALYDSYSSSVLEKDNIEGIKYIDCVLRAASAGSSAILN